MNITGYKEEEKVSRKQYLKNKNSVKSKSFKFLSYLLLIIIILLSIYLYKQLHIYNNVTKMTNQIIEENSLINNEKIYYVGTSYTKENLDILYEYNMSDNSRIEMLKDLDIKNIKVDKENVYCIVNESLIKINIKTLEKEVLYKGQIHDYILEDGVIYAYLITSEENSDFEKGLYVINIQTKNINSFVLGEVYQVLLDSKNIFVVKPSITEKSIVKYDIKGNFIKTASDKEIVSYISQNDNYIFFVNKSDEDYIYSLSKKTGTIKKLSKLKTFSKADKETSLNGTRILTAIGENIYYIETTNNNLMCLNIETLEEKVVDKKVDKIQVLGETLYFSKISDMNLYKYISSSGKIDNMTTIRSKEYVVFK